MKVYLITTLQYGIYSAYVFSTEERAKEYAKRKGLKLDGFASELDEIEVDQAIENL